MTQAIDSFRINDDVEFVLRHALKTSNKKANDDLTLVEILETYEHLIDNNKN